MRSPGNVLGELRSPGEARDWKSAEKLGTHPPRRKAARAILDAGGPFAQLLVSGQWRSAAYKLYFDLGREDTGAVASILIEASDEDQEARHRERAIGGFKVSGNSKADRPSA